MTTQPGANLLTQNAGLRPENIEVPHYDVRAPNVNDVNYPDGKRWLWVGNAEYVLLNKTSLGGLLQANWSVLGTSGGTLSTLTTQDSTVVVPVGGNINLSGAANQLTTTGSGNTATVGFVSAVVFPGSATATTSLAAGTTVTAGTDLVSTAGNVIINGSGKQLQVQGGAATDFIGTATLVLGTVTVLNTNIAATDMIIPSHAAKNASTAVGVLNYTISAGASFTINALNPADGTVQTGDLSTVTYLIVRIL